MVIVKKKCYFKTRKELSLVVIKVFFASSFKSVSGTIRGTQGYGRGAESRQRCLIAANLYFKTYYCVVVRGTWKVSRNSANKFPGQPRFRACSRGGDLSKFQATIKEESHRGAGARFRNRHEMRRSATQNSRTWERTRSTITVGLLSNCKRLTLVNGENVTAMPCNACKLEEHCCE